MSILEGLIKKLLANPELEYFEESRIFREKILDKQEAAEILVLMMETYPENLAARAGEMLSLFSIPALIPIAQGLSHGDSTWKINLLTIGWLVISNTENENPSNMLQAVLPYVLPLLSDYSTVEEKEVECAVEIENIQYRVCDEAYIFLRHLQDMDYDDVLFCELDFNGRDREIRMLTSRLNRPTV